MKDYYKILDLPPSATHSEIKAAFRRLAHQFHPDKNSGDLYASAQFDLIKEAYETLSHPLKKEQYLQHRWYEKSLGKKSKESLDTPVALLKRSLELEKYVSRLDEHRMDTDGLTAYIQALLSEETIRKMNAFDEPSVNSSIIQSLSKNLLYLSTAQANSISEKLFQLKAEQSTYTEITYQLKQLRIQHRWNRYRIVIVVAAVVLICVLIYYLSY